MRRRWTGLVLVLLLMTSPALGAPQMEETDHWWETAWRGLVQNAAAWVAAAGSLESSPEEPDGPIVDSDGAMQTEVEPPDGEVGPIADPNG